MVAEVLDVLDAVRSPDEIPPAPPLTVTRHLAAVGPSGEAALDAVIEEFLRIAHDLPWRQTAGYLDILSDEYLANYGYVQLVGPAPSIIEHPSVRRDGEGQSITFRVGLHSEIEHGAGIPLLAR